MGVYSFNHVFLVLLIKRHKPISPLIDKDKELKWRTNIFAWSVLNRRSKLTSVINSPSFMASLIRHFPLDPLPLFRYSLESVAVYIFRE